MARRSKATPKRLGEFLELLATNGNVTISADATNLDRRKLYRIRDENTDFASAWDAAMEQASDYLEAEARRRAVDGWEEPVFYQGEPTGLVRKFSDTLLIFLLKGARPEKFRDRSQTELTGPGGSALLPTAINVYLPSNGRDQRQLEEGEVGE